MKRIIPSLVCLAVGIGIGCYFGYSRPALRMQHLYQDVQKTTGMSDAEIVKQVPESLAAIGREDESVAMVAFAFQLRAAIKEKKGIEISL